MVTVVTTPRSNFGGALGTGLGQGLEALAQYKLQQVQQRQARQNIQPGLEQLGFTPQEAQSYSSFEPTILRDIVKQKVQEPQQLAYAEAINNLLGVSSPQSQLQQMQEPELRQTQEGLIYPKNRQQGTPVNAREQIQQQRLQQATQEQQRQTQLSRLNEKQVTELAKLGFQKQEAESRRNAAVEKSNSGYLKNLEKQVEPARAVRQTIQEMRDLLSTGQVKTGAISGLIPTALQNETTQSFVAKANELVTQKAQLGKGVPSRMRLQLEQASKPTLWHKPGAIEYLLNTFEEAVKPSLQQEAIKDQLIQENGGRQPENLEAKARKRYQQIKDLPEATDFTEDAIIKANGKSFARSGDTWIPL